MNFDVFMAEYGIQAAVIALISIIVVGIVKLVFKKKLEALGAAKCKTVYQLTVTVVVYAATALWIRLSGYPIDPVEWLKEGTVAYAASQVMYPVYENYHLRDFVEMGVEFLKKKFISKEGK